MIQFHEITIKGYFPQMRKDIIGSFCDAPQGMSWGKLIFKGADNELDDFYEHALGYANNYYKVIGINSYPVEGYDITGKIILTPKNKDITFCN